MKNKRCFYSSAFHTLNVYLYDHLMDDAANWRRYQTDRLLQVLVHGCGCGLLEREAMAKHPVIISDG